MSIFLAGTTSVGQTPTAGQLPAAVHVDTYRALLGAREPLLAFVCSAAAELPITINGHASLQPGATPLPGRQPPYPEAQLGPAGLCLHAWFGSSARALALVLNLPTVRVSLQEADALQRYRETLIEEHYAPSELLTAGLAGAICAEAIDALLQAATYLQTMAQSHASRLDSKTGELKTLQDRFSELLDLCDTLALQDRQSVIDCANDYRLHDRQWRARRLVKTYLQQHPDDVDVRRLAAELVPLERVSQRHLETLENAVASNPANAALRRRLGLALLQKLAVPEALTMLNTALELDTENKAIRNDVQRAENMAAVLAAASDPTRMPAVTLEVEELRQQRFHPETLALLAYLYQHHGTLAITNAFDARLLEQCRTQFVRDYRHYLTDVKHEDALQIGDRRFQVSLKLDGSFNQPDFYANPFVLSLMRRLLGRKAVIGSTVCATSLPGSRRQHVHKDHRALFTADAEDDPISLPPVAITTMIPLVPVDELIGTTQVKKGSHKLSRKASEALAWQTPILPLGGFFLMDLALSHRGQGNRTDQVRPIVNMVYHQSWFTDNKNFRKQPPLQINEREYAKIPDQHRPLFDWATQPGPSVDH